ncbi:MAG: hypothetical protein KH146_14450, partial [Eggerthella sp.]|uniref:hypothetical protein n=1 Tax=Eggerthella sp. TaxID=1929886 RepID=UPI001ED79786
GNHVFGEAFVHIIEHGGELPIKIDISRQSEDVVPCHCIESDIFVRIEEDEAFRFAGSRKERAKPELISRPRWKAEDGILATELVTKTIVLLILPRRL